MSKSISNIDWMNQLENVIREFCKGKIRADHEGRNPDFPRNGTRGNVE